MKPEIEIFDGMKDGKKATTQHVPPSSIHINGKKTTRSKIKQCLQD